MVDGVAEEKNGDNGGQTDILETLGGEAGRPAVGGGGGRGSGDVAGLDVPEGGDAVAAGVQVTAHQLRLLEDGGAGDLELRGALAAGATRQLPRQERVVRHEAGGIRGTVEERNGRVLPGGDRGHAEELFN